MVGSLPVAHSTSAMPCIWYTLVEKDFRDMGLLQKRFGLPLPPQLVRV